MASKARPTERQLTPTPRGATPPPKKQGGASEADVEIMEFLEGLLEGFRAAAAANAAQGNNGPRQPKWFEQGGNRSGDWTDLNELEKSLPAFSSGVDAYASGVGQTRGKNSRSASPTPGATIRPGDLSKQGVGSFTSDPLSTMMRRHALRSFLEEMCGSVAKAFEQMATLAVKNSLGSQGGVGLPEQRMKYKFGPGDFQKTLSSMEYGMGAGQDWWNALFKSIDVDEDGAISLQDMYDALVLDLPPLPAGPSGDTNGSLFFSGSSSTGRNAFAPSPRGGYPSSPRGGAASLNSTMNSPAGGNQQTLNLKGLFNDECQVCGADCTNDMVVCQTCGTKRV